MAVARCTSLMNMLVFSAWEECLFWSVAAAVAEN